MLSRSRGLGRLTALIHLTATELLKRLAAGDVTSVDVTQAYLDQIESHDGRIRAFLRTDGQTALATAEDVDRRRKAGQAVGKLAGLPVAVKDVICTEGELTTCASRMLENFSPPYDATVIQRLKDADAVLIGKTNMDEFAMGSTTENSFFGATRNPWDTDRVPGGSSGGAAACVAASMAPLSIGSDTGGSIRQPASFCGVTGMKPTYGRVSRYGLVAFASSLDQIGPLAASVEDAALLLDVLAGHDPLDSTSANMPVPDYSATVGQKLDGLTIGIVREHFAEGLDADVESAVREAVDVYRSLGAQVREISLPHSKYAIATYYIIAPSEASSNLARYDGVHYGYRTDEKAMLSELNAERKALEAAGDQQALDRLDTALVRMYRKTRVEGFGPEVKRRIMLGTYALSAGYYDAYYVKALKVRRLVHNDYVDAFGKVDVIAGPVAPTAAYVIGEKSDDPLAMYLGDLYTVGANLAGIPSISVPCGFTAGGLPVGLQLQGPAMQEQRLLQAAHMFQQATDWHTRRPELTS
ncbi:MAG: aspartyl/glutamyl-tRNA amidotransferase subunit A [Planctomycetes bacterium]|nr:aspartyl/glutamyl-tRNA amidotransferase subunit A [Planctomycetota bacterium]